MVSCKHFFARVCVADVGCTRCRAPCAVQCLPCRCTPTLPASAIVVDSHRIQLAVVSSNNGSVSVAEDVHLAASASAIPRANLSSSGVPYERAVVLSRRIRLSAHQCNMQLDSLRRGVSNTERSVRDVHVSVYDLPPADGSMVGNGAAGAPGRPSAAAAGAVASTSAVPSSATARKRRCRIVAVDAADAACVVRVVVAISFRDAEVGHGAATDGSAASSAVHRMHLGLSYTLHGGGVVARAAHFVWPTEDTTLDWTVEPLQLAILDQARWLPVCWSWVVAGRVFPCSVWHGRGCWGAV